MDNINIVRSLLTQQTHTTHITEQLYVTLYKQPVIPAENKD